MDKKKRFGCYLIALVKFSYISSWRNSGLLIMNMWWEAESNYPLFTSQRPLTILVILNHKIWSQAKGISETEFGANGQWWNRAPEQSIQEDNLLKPSSTSQEDVSVMSTNFLQFSTSSFNLCQEDQSFVLLTGYMILSCYLLCEPTFVSSSGGTNARFKSLKELEQCFLGGKGMDRLRAWVVAGICIEGEQPRNGSCQKVNTNVKVAEPDTIV